MNSEVVTITPEEARVFLEENNIDNRRIRPKHVQSLAADMRAGRWKVTHQGIAFSKSGRLLDGQHRLAAIVEANIPVKIMVTQGVPDEGYIAMDQHATRHIGDATTESWLTAQVGATARAAMEADHVSTSNKTFSPTISEVHQFALRWEDSLRFAAETCTSMGRGLNKAQIRAAVMRAHASKVDPDALRGFLKVYKTGIMERPGDVAAILLRNYVQATRFSGTAQHRELYLKTARAILAYINGEEFTRLYAAAVDPFPLRST